MRKKKLISILMITALMICFLPVAQASASERILQETPLVAGQSMIVGKVTIAQSDSGQISVTYSLSEDALTDGWLIYETHLAVGDSLSDIPQNKSHNPIPGNFEYSKSFASGTPEYTEYISTAGLMLSSKLYVAAHAVIKKVSYITLASAPYPALQVSGYDQGVRYDGTSVLPGRSNPNNGLFFETGASESNFYSLGFTGVDNDGWYIVEFDKPVLNGPGSDLQVIEDTFGLPYPVEKAEVFVSQDKINWISLGNADNQHPISNLHTVSEFDLSNVGLSSARFVKLQDRSVRDDFGYLYSTQGATLDGYDVNAILALQDYVEESSAEETAWGSGTRFNCQGSWGMYITVQLNSGSCGGLFRPVFSCSYLKNLLSDKCFKLNICDYMNFRYTCNKFKFSCRF